MEKLSRQRVVTGLPNEVRRIDRIPLLCFDGLFLCWHTRHDRLRHVLNRDQLLVNVGFTLRSLHNGHFAANSNEGEFDWIAQDLSRSFNDSPS